MCSRKSDPWLCWQRFWFARETGVQMSVLRILVGLISLDFARAIFPYLDTFYTDSGIATQQSAQIWWRTPVISLFHFLPPTTDSAQLLWIVLVVFSALTTMGLWSRFVSAGLFLLLVSFHNRDPFILNSGDTLLRLLVLYVVLADSGRFFSLDAWWRARKGVARPFRVAAWPRRLVQLQVAALYCQASIAKLDSPMWRDGQAFSYCLQLAEFVNFSIPDFILSSWFALPASWFVIAAEFSMWTLVFVPRLRRLCLALGLALHAGIAVCLAIPIFQAAMLSSYVAFLVWNDSRLVRNRLRGLFRFRLA